MKKLLLSLFFLFFICFNAIGIQQVPSSMITNDNPNIQGTTLNDVVNNVNSNIVVVSQLVVNIEGNTNEWNGAYDTVIILSNSWFASVAYLISASNTNNWNKWLTESNSYVTIGIKIGSSTNSDYATVANITSNLTEELTNTIITVLSNLFVSIGAKVGSSTNSDYATVANITSNLTEDLTNVLLNAANHTNRLATMVFGPITTNASPDNYIVLGPIPYALTITNIIGYGDGDTWVGDLFTSDRTDIIGTRSLVFTGLTYTVDTLITNEPVNISVPVGSWVGFVLTNGLSPTNAWVSVQGTY